MFDDLLGRSGLRARIDELEEERERLEGRLEGERERRREAVRDRQAADERVNRLEDRIADLEGRLERTDEEAEPAFRGVESLRGERTREVLRRLGSLRTAEEGTLTAMVEEELPDAVAEAFGEHAALLARAAPCLVARDDAGLLSSALVPPIRPEPFVIWSDAVELERGWFVPEGEFAFALVRSDLFALGEYEGRERRSLTTFESDVKGDHSKGGFSQGRFERRRDAQIDEHLERCEEAITDRGADRLIVVGQRTLLKGFAEEAIETRPIDATGKPAAALDRAFHEFWTTRLYQV
ncbi:Vms1/Ankzf1 family peptidyl-tRNA hydrolase [Halalkalicoccus ordinarius]|uniref:Vms1/Ankzf1 family peptidyl-tRNA hydrolase n=1 Tax=Halalkalicoccus ordinarius TaxID=3116651 RepID=UPI00300F78FA